MLTVRNFFIFIFLFFFLIPQNNAFSAEGDYFKSEDWIWFDEEFGSTQVSLADKNKAPFDLGGSPVSLNISIKNSGGKNEINKIFKLQFSNTSDFSGEVSSVSASSTCEQRSIWCYGNKDGINNNPGQSTTTEFSFSLKNMDIDYKKTAYFFRLYDPMKNKPITPEIGKAYPSIVSKGSEFLFDIDDTRALRSSLDGGVPSLFLNLSLTRGEKWQSQMVLINNNKKEVVVEIGARDFEEKEASLTPIMKMAGGDNINGYFASGWLKFPTEKITVPGNSSVTIPFEVDIPLSAEPGDYHPGVAPSVFFELNNKGASTSLSAIELSPLIISLSIKGSIRERGRVADFSTKNIFYYKPNIDLNFKFENFGDVHLEPSGWIKVHDFWGNELDIDKQYSSIRFNTVEPGKTFEKIFDLILDDSSFGYYYATLNIFYGNADKQKIEKTINFFVVPADFWTNVGLSLVGIFLFFKFGVRFIMRKFKSRGSRRIKIN